MNPKGTWNNAALYYVVPAISGADFAVGLQFLFNMLGDKLAKTTRIERSLPGFLFIPNRRDRKSSCGYRYDNERGIDYPY